MHELAQVQRRDDLLRAAAAAGHLSAPECGDFEHMMREGDENEDWDEAHGGRPPTQLLSELRALEQEHGMLEAELMGMGIDIDEQEALLSSLAEGTGRGSPDDEVAVLLSTLQRDDLNIVEVC